MDSFSEVDIRWMNEAIQLAQHAASVGEVPIAALVVFENELISTGYNLRETLQDPTAHAEMIAIREASRAVGSWRLIDCTLYVTLEPCPMCAGAAINSRLTRCVYGASDPKAGAAHSLFSLMSDPRLNHRVELAGGCLEDECGVLLTSFFRAIRDGKGIPKPRSVASQQSPS